MVSNLHRPRSSLPREPREFILSSDLTIFRTGIPFKSLIPSLRSFPEGEFVLLALPSPPATFSLTCHNLSSTYSLSWWSLLASTSKIQWLFHPASPTPPFGCILLLKLATLGFWANGCPRSHSSTKTLFFSFYFLSSTCARFTQDPSLNPFFIFTRHLLNSAQVLILHFHQDISHLMAHPCPYSQALPLTVFAMFFIA